MRTNLGNCFGLRQLRPLVGLDQNQLFPKHHFHFQEYGQLLVLEEGFVFFGEAVVASFEADVQGDKFVECSSMPVLSGPRLPFVPTKFSPSFHDTASFGRNLPRAP